MRGRRARDARQGAHARCGVPARVRTWFYSDATSAALAWLAAIALCAGVLAWFFVASPYGAPAAPVYAEF